MVSVLSRPAEQCRAFARHYIRDLVYAANDGVVTTFAVAAGAQGAHLPALTVLALGFANLAADGLSMAVGNYLGIKSERAAELQHRFHNWHETRHALKHGLVTWAAFVIAGLMPLLPYVLSSEIREAFRASVAFSAVAMLAIGAARTLVTGRSAWRSGLEMLAVGALAGAAAYGVGWVIQALMDGMPALG